MARPGRWHFVEASEPVVALDNPQVLVADFDADGYPDLAVLDVDNFVTMLLGNGDGTFRPGILVGTGVEPGAFVAGDFNHDGLPDVATANYMGQSVSILLNNSRRHSPSAPTRQH